MSVRVNCTVIKRTPPHPQARLTARITNHAELAVDIQQLCIDDCKVYANVSTHVLLDWSAFIICNHLLMVG